MLIQVYRGPGTQTSTLRPSEWGGVQGGVKWLNVCWPSGTLTPWTSLPGRSYPGPAPPTPAPPSPPAALEVLSGVLQLRSAFLPDGHQTVFTEMKPGPWAGLLLVPWGCLSETQMRKTHPKFSELHSLDMGRRKGGGHLKVGGQDFRSGPLMKFCIGGHRGALTGQSRGPGTFAQGV